MTGPIDVAYVDIEAHTDQFESKAVSSFEQIEAIADRVVDAIENAFKGMADVIERQFEELRRDADLNMDALITAVDTAATEIGVAVNDGTEVAERGFDELRRSADRDLEAISVKSKETSATVNRHFNALGAGIASAATIGITVAGAGLAALTGFGLKSAASLEQVQIQFASLTGSATEGQKVFTDLQKFAATTPFEFPDVAHAAARFLAFDQAVGLSDSQLQDFLTTTGNVIAVTGGGAQALNTVSLAMGQIASTGKLTLDNLNQISEALPGFSSVQAIANATGRSTADVMSAISKGEIDATTGIQALLKGMQQFPGAAGAMAAQGQTLLGVFSTFKDTVSQALAGAFTPVIPAIKDSLTQITPVLGEALGQLAPALGGLVASVLPLIGQLVQGLTPVLTPIVSGLGTALTSIGPAISGLLGALAPLATALQPLLVLLGQIIGALGSALGPVLNVIATSIGTTLTPIVEALGKVFVALQPSLITLAQAFGNQLAPIFTALADQAPQIADAIVQLTPDLIQLAEAMTRSVVASAPLIDLIVKMIPLLFELTAASGPILKFVIDLAAAVADLPGALGNLINEFQTWVSSVGTSAGNLVSGVLNWFTSIPQQAGSALSSLPETLLNVLSNAANQILFAVGFVFGSIIHELMAFPGQVVSIVKSAWDTVYAFTVSGIDAMLNFVAELPFRLGSLIYSAWSYAVALFHNGVNAVADTARSLPGRVWDAIQSLPGLVGDILGRLGSVMYNAGRNAIVGLVNGIQDLLGWAVNAAWNAAKRIADGFFSALQIKSPSMLFFKGGQQSIQGYVLGAEYEARTTTSPLASIVNPTLSAPISNTTGTGIGAGGFAGTVMVSIGGRQVDAVITDILYANPQDVAQAADLGGRQLARR